MKPITQAKRIHIWGNSGSGKTTLAKQLAFRLNAPYYELDEVAYLGFNWTKSLLEERIKTLSAVVAQPAWVSEGVYLWWTEILFEAADLIIWLDLPMSILGYRIVRRHFRWQPTNRANPFPNCYFLMLHLLRVMRIQFSPRPRVPRTPDHDTAVTRIAVQQLLKSYSEKVVHCTSVIQVATFEAQFCNHDMNPTMISDINPGMNTSNQQSAN